MATDWKSATAVVAAISSVIVPLLLWQFDKETKSLAVRQVSTVSLQPGLESPLPGLKISIDGVEVARPYISTFEISNEGSRPIAASDFDAPFSLHVQPGIVLISARVAALSPADMPATLQMRGTAVSLNPLLINPGDVITASILTSGGIPEFRATGRIAGISKIGLEDEGRKSHVLWALVVYLPVALVGMTLYFLYIIPMTRRSWMPGPIARALSGITAGMGSAFALQELAKAFEVEARSAGFFQLMAALAAVAALIAFAVYRMTSRRRYGGTTLS